MSAFLANVVDVPAGGAIVVAGVILARRGERIAAFVNQCPHAGYPLQRADGTIIVQEGRYLLCAAHGASFELDTGACAGGPCNGTGLAALPIQVSDGRVFRA